jgi:cytochrome c-type biogenesis protein CcmE
MIFLRLIVVVALATLGLSLVLYVVTRNRRYLVLAGQILKIGVIVGLVIGALFLVERLILI